MLSRLFLETVLSTFLCTICFNAWYLYYLTINFFTNPAGESTDVKKPKTIELSKNMHKTTIGLIILWAVLMNIIFIFNSSTRAIFCDSISISQLTTTYLYLFLTIFLIILLTGLSLRAQNMSFSPEYLIFVLLIGITSYLLIGSTSLFLSIFLLEFISLLILAKMALSRLLVTQSAQLRGYSSATTRYSYGLFNSLFFQFWANFISSVCLFFSLLNTHYLFGTSNFFFVNFLLSVVTATWYASNTFTGVILIILVMGLFIKLGLSPYQFFKIETYKGIPLFIIIVYTTVYLSSYIFFFIFLINYQLVCLREFVDFYISFVFIVSLVYLVILLFDTKSFKAFLAYSTLITISNLLLIVLIL